VEVGKFITILLSFFVVYRFVVGESGASFVGLSINPEWSVREVDVGVVSVRIKF
jgi:hypothetical protein